MLYRRIQPSTLHCLQSHFQALTFPSKAVTRALKTADAALPSKSADVKQIDTRALYIPRIAKSVFGEASSCQHGFY
jgi:hypothetical protein